MKHIEVLKELRDNLVGRGNLNTGTKELIQQQFYAQQNALDHAIQVLKRLEDKGSMTKILEEHIENELRYGNSVVYTVRLDCKDLTQALQDYLRS